MSVEADGQLQELDTLLNDFKQIVAEFSSSQLGSKQKYIRQGDFVLQQLRSARDAFMIEIRYLERSQSERYVALLDERIQTQIQLVKEYDWHKSEYHRNLILQETDQKEVLQPADLSRDQIIQVGDHLQDKTQDALDRMKATTEETKQIGQNVAVELDKQGKRLDALHGEIDQIDSSLSRARGTVASIAKNIGSDRCVQVMGVLVILLVIALLVVIFVPAPSAA